MTHSQESDVQSIREITKYYENLVSKDNGEILGKWDHLKQCYTNETLTEERQCISNEGSNRLSGCGYEEISLMNYHSKEFQLLNHLKKLDQITTPIGTFINEVCSIQKRIDEIESEISNLENGNQIINELNLQNMKEQLVIEKELNSKSSTLFLKTLLNEMNLNYVNSNDSSVDDYWDRLKNYWMSKEISPEFSAETESEESWNQLKAWYNEMGSLFQNENLEYYTTMFNDLPSNWDKYLNSSLLRLNNLNNSMAHYDLLYYEIQTTLTIFSLHVSLATIDLIGLDINESLYIEDELMKIQEMINQIEKLYNTIKEIVINNTNNGYDDDNSECLLIKILEMKRVSIIRNENDLDFELTNNNWIKLTKSTGLYSCYLNYKKKKENKFLFNFESGFDQQVIDQIITAEMKSDNEIITIKLINNNKPQAITNPINNFQNNNIVLNTNDNIDKSLDITNYWNKYNSQKLNSYNNNHPDHSNLNNKNPNNNNLNNNHPNNNHPNNNNPNNNNPNNNHPNNNYPNNNNPNNNDLKNGPVPEKYYKDGDNITQMCEEGYYCPGDGQRYPCVNKPQDKASIYSLSGEYTSVCEFNCLDTGYYANEELTDCIEIPIGYYSKDGSRDLLQCTFPVDDRFSVATSIGEEYDASCNYTFVYQAISNENITFNPNGEFTIQMWSEIKREQLNDYFDYNSNEQTEEESGFKLSLIGIHKLFDLSLYIGYNQEIENLTTICFQYYTSENETKFIQSKEFEINENWFHYALSYDHFYQTLIFYINGEEFDKISFNLQTIYYDSNNLYYFLYLAGERYYDPNSIPSVSHFYFGYLDQISFLGKRIEEKFLDYNQNLTTNLERYCLNNDNEEQMLTNKFNRRQCFTKCPNNTKLITNSNYFITNDSNWSSSSSNDAENYLNYDCQCPDNQRWDLGRCIQECPNGTYPLINDPYICECPFNQYQVWYLENSKYITFIINSKNYTDLFLSTLNLYNSKNELIKLSNCYQILLLNEEDNCNNYNQDNLMDCNMILNEDLDEGDLEFPIPINSSNKIQITFEFEEISPEISIIELVMNSKTNLTNDDDEDGDINVGELDLFISTSLPDNLNNNYCQMFNESLYSELGSIISQKISIHNNENLIHNRNITNNYSSLLKCVDCLDNSTGSISPKKSIFHCKCHKQFVQSRLGNCVYSDTSLVIPNISHDSGHYQSGTTISIDFTSNSFSICNVVLKKYSKNDPNTIQEKNLYLNKNNNQFTIYSSLNATFIMTQDGSFSSQPIKKIYTIYPTVIDPQIRPLPNDTNYKYPSRLYIKCETMDAIIRYTLDGSDVFEDSSTIYTNTAEIFTHENFVLTVKAFKNDSFPSQQIRLSYRMEIKNQISITNQEVSVTSDFIIFIVLLILLFITSLVILFLIKRKKKKIQKQIILNEIDIQGKNYLISDNEKSSDENILLNNDEIELESIKDGTSDSDSSSDTTMTTATTTGTSTSSSGTTSGVDLDNDNDNNNGSKIKKTKSLKLKFKNQKKNKLDLNDLKKKKKIHTCDFCNESKNSAWLYPNFVNEDNTLYLCKDCAKKQTNLIYKIRFFSCDCCGKIQSHSNLDILYFNQKENDYLCFNCYQNKLENNLIKNSNIFKKRFCQNCKIEEALWECNKCKKFKYFCMICETIQHQKIGHIPKPIRRLENVVDPDITIPVKFQQF
ncbi:hypothetical protein M0813_10001 [Anaeramoeba flamelloides]|uniref:GH29D-like beta-sandwich domain-containing protein n=1 Tax=Anaeramoeba flamelloides TaxID=1746091 RepID=A0ABQ8X5N4_9EUKA|nr:hypothetical protein M0813_10001 [Anaeramoeba flamelloides]